MAATAPVGSMDDWATRVRAGGPGHKAFDFGPCPVLGSSDGALKSELAKLLASTSKLDSSFYQLKAFPNEGPQILSSDSITGDGSLDPFKKALRPPQTVTHDPESPTQKVCTRWSLTAVTLPDNLPAHLLTKAVRFLKENAMRLLRGNYGLRKDETERGARAMPFSSADDQATIVLGTDCRDAAARHRAALLYIVKSIPFRELLRPPPARPITLVVKTTSNTSVPPSWGALAATLAPYGSLLKIQRSRDETKCLVSPGEDSQEPPSLPVVTTTEEVSNNPYITSGSHALTVQTTLPAAVTPLQPGTAEADVTGTANPASSEADDPHINRGQTDTTEVSPPSSLDATSTTLSTPTCRTPTPVATLLTSEAAVLIDTPSSLNPKELVVAPPKKAATSRKAKDAPPCPRTGTAAPPPAVNTQPIHSYVSKVVTPVAAPPRGHNLSTAHVALFGGTRPGTPSWGNQAGNPFVGFPSCFPPTRLAGRHPRGSSDTATCHSSRQPTETRALPRPPH